MATLNLPGWENLFIIVCLLEKKVVLSNLNRVFGQILSLQEIISLAQGFYTHVARSLKETFLTRLISLEKHKDKVMIKGEQHILDLVFSGEFKGAMLITGHFGSWEFAPVVGISHFPQYRGQFYFVRKVLSFKWLEKILFKNYNQAGLKVIPKKNSLNKVCDALENYGVVIFVIDQHASLGTKDGIKVDFFGEPSGTYKSPAIIARYTKVPVFPVRSYRQQDGRHVLEFFPQIPWISSDDEKEEILINTRQYNQWIEKFIIDYPDQWLWFHKRWKV